MLQKWEVPPVRPQSEFSVTLSRKVKPTCSFSGGICRIFLFSAFSGSHLGHFTACRHLTKGQEELTSVVKLNQSPEILLMFQNFGGNDKQNLEMRCEFHLSMLSLYQTASFHQEAVTKNCSKNTQLPLDTHIDLLLKKKKTENEAKP